MNNIITSSFARSRLRAGLSWMRFLPIVAAALIGGLFAAVSASAQPANLLKIPLSDATGSTTTASDTSLGGAAVTLNLLNASGVATDLHGIVGSGVNGAITGARALTLTNGEGGAQPGSGNGNVAQDASDPNLGFGSITNFIVTMWVNQVAQIPATIGPRFFILGNGGIPSDTGVANSIGVKVQANNQLYFSIGTNASLGSAVATAFPANQWLFFAFVYDGTNLYQYDGSSAATCVLASQASYPGQTVSLGNPSSLILGNRGSKARGLDGWMQDFRLYKGTAGNAAANQAFVEGIRAQLAPLPKITALSPDGNSLEQGTGAGQTLSFNASSSSANMSYVDVVLNGTDISSSLHFSPALGTATNIAVTYNGLPQQQINTMTITIRDANGLSLVAPYTFDTFNATNFMLKAEEFDFNGGQYIQNPDYTDGNPADANSYYGLTSVEGVDTHKGPGVGDNANDYRYDGDAPPGADTQTPLAAGELALPRIVNAPLDGGGNPQQNHEIADWSSGEWQNYTKVFPAGNYNVYARLLTASGSTVVFDQVVNGRGTPNQTLNNLGTFTLSGSGFQWVPLMKLGTLAVVNLGGLNTVRATTGGGASADLYMFVPANPTLPVLSNVKPDGSVLFQNTNMLSFTVSSTSTTISTSNIHLSLNGVDVSSYLTFSGTSSSWNCHYMGLIPNQTYVTSIHATDDNGGSVSGNLTIDTWTPILQFEAEDFDFDPAKSPISDGTGFRFIDNAVPTPAGVAAANSYEGQTGDELIDQSGVGAGTRSYRPGDVATTVVTDTPRSQFTQANAQDYNVGFLGAGFWEDYTRTWPAGTYNVYGRMASGASQSGLPTPPGIRDDFNLVEDGAGTTNQILDYVGTFNIPTTNGYSSYLYVPLLDRYGNYANVTMSGKETFRSTLDLTTTAGVAQFGLNINFYMLTAPRTDLPRIDNVYPDGTVLDQQSSQFSFVASDQTYGISTTNIHLTLNGVDVSSNLSFSGSTGSWTVTYSGLQPNVSYTAVMTITDNHNQSHSTTVTFDTFSSSNYTWEAEDFDFDPGFSPIATSSTNRFIDNPVPTDTPATNSYWGQSGDPGIDYANLFGNTRPGPAADYLFRSFDTIACAPTTDAARAQYTEARLAANDAGIQDYEIDYWDTNGWINYTRTFPTGNYFVYARVSAGNGAFSLQFSQVTAGAGTSSQTTQYLGSFVGTGTSFTTWQYVPLVNTNTGLPISMHFGGVETFQVTGDYNEDVNFFALVPPLPNTPTLTAAVNGSQVNISVPTQSGFSYQVYYKNNLTDPAWQPLGSAISGDGSVHVVTDTVGTARFYIVGTH